MGFNGFYTRTLCLPRIRMRHIALYAVGFCVVRAITCPPNPPPEPPQFIIACLDVMHRHHLTTQCDKK